MPRLARLASLLLVTAAAFGAAGCFEKEEKTTVGHTEGIYVTVDDLKYQVQISRILDPASPEDSAYLRGVPAAEGDPGQDEVWFAVFMRVENTSDDAHGTAEDSRSPTRRATSSSRSTSTPSSTSTATRRRSSSRAG